MTVVSPFWKIRVRRKNCQRALGCKLWAFGCKLCALGNGLEKWWWVGNSRGTQGCLGGKRKGKSQGDGGEGIILYWRLDGILRQKNEAIDESLQPQTDREGGVEAERYWPVKKMKLSMSRCGRKLNEKVVLRRNVIGRQITKLLMRRGSRKPNEKVVAVLNCVGQHKNEAVDVSRHTQTEREDGGEAEHCSPARNEAIDVSRHLQTGREDGDQAERFSPARNEAIDVSKHPQTEREDDGETER